MGALATETKLHGNQERAATLLKLLQGAHLPLPAEVWVTRNGAFITMTADDEGRAAAEKVAKFVALAGLTAAVERDDSAEGGAYYVSMDWGLKPAQS